MPWILALWCLKISSGDLFDTFFFFVFFVFFFFYTCLAFGLFIVCLKDVSTTFQIGKIKYWLSLERNMLWWKKQRWDHYILFIATSSQQLYSTHKSLSISTSFHISIPLFTHCILLCFACARLKKSCARLKEEIDEYLLIIRHLFHTLEQFNGKIIDNITDQSVFWLSHREFHRRKELARDVNDIKHVSALPCSLIMSMLNSLSPSTHQKRDSYLQWENN